MAQIYESKGFPVTTDDTITVSLIHIKERNGQCGAIQGASWYGFCQHNIPHLLTMHWIRFACGFRNGVLS